MIAEDVGRSLLDEIKEERLEKILRDLYRLQSPQRCSRLRVQCLDDVLDALQYGPSRNETFDLPPCASKTSPAGCGTVIEVTGSSCSGKTHLLYMVTARGVLPRHLGCREGTVIVLDTDCRFDVARLYQIMVYQVEKARRRPHAPPVLAADAQDNIDVKSTVNEALHHVHIFRPQSLASLIATAHSLSHYLLRADASEPVSADRSADADDADCAEAPQLSSDRTLHAVLFDGASAFYWEDRLEQDRSLVGHEVPPATAATVAQAAPLPSFARRPTTRLRILSTVMPSLRNLQELSPSTILIYTTWNISSLSTVSKTALQSSLFNSRNLPAPALFRIELERRRCLFPLSDESAMDGTACDHDSAGSRASRSDNGKNSLRLPDHSTTTGGSPIIADQFLQGETLQPARAAVGARSKSGVNVHARVSFLSGSAMDDREQDQPSIPFRDANRGMDANQGAAGVCSLQLANNSADNPTDVKDGKLSRREGDLWSGKTTLLVDPDSGMRFTFASTH